MSKPEKVYYATAICSRILKRILSHEYVILEKSKHPLSVIDTQDVIDEISDVMVEINKEENKNESTKNKKQA